MFRHLMFVAPLATLIAAASAQAGHSVGGCAPCDPCAMPSGDVHYVQKTICVPEWVTETRTVLCTQYVQEQREITQTVYRPVYETTQVERTCTVMVPERRTKTVPYCYYKPIRTEYEKKYCVQVPVWGEEERQYTVMVPEVEKRQGVRQVCKWTEEEVVKTIQKDCGHWEVQMVQVPCHVKRHCWHRSCCDPCCVPMKTVCRKCWVPNIVEEQVTVKVCKPVMVEETYEYCVTVCKPETRTCVVKVCHMQTEERTMTCYKTDYQMIKDTREVAYTVCVPQEKTWIQNVTTCKQVPEEVKRTITVCVPQQVEKEVQVQVCQMTQKTIQVPVRTVSCCKPRCCRPCCR